MTKHGWPSLGAVGVALWASMGCTDGVGDGTSDQIDGGAADASAEAIVEEVVGQWASSDVIANRLAKLIWNLPPDTTVTEGLSGDLTREKVGRLADVMLDDVRARQGVIAFYRWWLFFEGRSGGLNSKVSSDDADPLNRDLYLEGPLLGAHITLSVKGTFEDLLTAPYTFMNERVASRYGVENVSGMEMRPIAYPAAEPRIGLLTGAGVLSFFSSLVNPSWPAKRSWLITDLLLCRPIIQSFLPSVAPDVSRSIRQQMIDVTESASCMSCHRLLNSPGFAMIGFDSLGRWHPEPGRAPNETEGSIPEDIIAGAPTFVGPAELAKLLGGRDEARRCFAQQWLEYAGARGRRVSVDQQPPSLDAVFAKFKASGFRLRDLIVAVATSNQLLRP